MLVPRSLAAMGKVCDRDSTRYALGGIFFERDSKGRPHAVATDGRRLVHATWVESDEFPESAGDRTAVPGFETILPAEAITAAARGAKLSARMQRMRPNLNSVLIQEPGANGTVRVAATNYDTTAAADVRSIEGRFPKWRDVVPSYDPLPAELLAFKGEDSLDELAESIWEAEGRRYAAGMRTAEAARRWDEYFAAAREVDPDFVPDDGPPVYKAADVDPEEVPAPKGGQLELYQNATKVLFRALRHNAARVSLDPALLGDLCSIFAGTTYGPGYHSVEFEFPLRGEGPVKMSSKSAEGLELNALLMPLATSR